VNDGSHIIRIRGVDPFCNVPGGSTRKAVVGGHSVRVSFVITCGTTARNRLLTWGSRNGEYPHMFSVAADSSAVAELTPDSNGASDGQWSPDGTGIAFVRYGTDAGVWVMKADRPALRRVTSGAEPTWSPDGRRIAFADNGGVYVVGVDGVNPVRL